MINIKGAIATWAVLNIFLLPALFNRLSGTDYIVYFIVTVMFIFFLFTTPKYFTLNLAKVGFAIGLILALPIFTSVAMADEINDIQISGQAGIPSFVNPTDIIAILVNVTIPGDTNITKNQIMLQMDYNNQNYALFFDECTESQGDTDCEPTDDPNTFICACVNIFGSDLQPVIDDVSDLNFLVFDSWPPGQPIDTQVEYVYLDDTPPVIDSLKTSQQEDQLQVDLTLHDPGIRHQGLEKCSGLDRIEFFANDQQLSMDTVMLDSETNYCGQETILKNLSYSTSGNVTIKAVAYDKLGNAGELSAEAEYMDFSPPVIDPNFKVYLAGREVDYISTSGPTAGLRAAQLQFTVVEHNITSIHVNLSSLNDNIIYKDKYKSLDLDSDGVQVACTNDDNFNTCRLTKEDFAGIGMSDEDFFIRVSDPNLQFELTVTDDVGLSTSETMTKQMLVDNDKGEVDFLGTFRCNDDMCFINDETNTIKALINDPGAGFDYSLVFFDSAQFNGAAQPTQLWCGLQDGAWQCQRNFEVTQPLVHGTGYMLTLDPMSFDDAGNQLQGKVQTIIKYDNQPPVISNESSIVSIRTDNTKANYVRSGETLYITLKGNDDVSGVVNSQGRWDIYTDLSAVMADTDGDYSQVQADQCVQYDNGDFECTWQAGPVTDYYDGALPFSVRDVAGNLNDTFKMDLTVYKLEPNPSSEPWDLKDNKVECMPAAVDRLITRYWEGGNKIWCSFQLNANQNYVAFDIQKADECTPSNQAADYFHSSELFGNQLITGAGLTPPVGLFTIIDFDEQTIAPNVTSFEFTCPYKISYGYIGDGTKVAYETPQLLNVSWELPVKGGVASLEKSLENNLGALKNRLRSNKWLDSTKKVIDGLKAVCSLLDLYNTITAAFDEGSSLLTFLDAYPITKPVAEVLGTLADTTTKSDKVFFTAGQKFCNFLDCKIGLTDLLTSGKSNGAGHFFKNIRTYGVSKDNPKLQNIMSLNPEDSLILSAALLCIPGVLYNLEKAKQIDCNYVFCMEKLVPAGTTPYACAYSRYVLWCEYVFGQFFALIPFVSFIQDVAGMLSNMLSDPFALGFGIVGALCSPMWHTTLMSGWICDMTAILGQVSATFGSLSHVVDKHYGGMDFCAAAGI